MTQKLDRPTEPDGEELFSELLDLPLYAPYELGFGATRVRSLRLYKGKLDRFCPGCGRHSIWQAEVSPSLRMAEFDDETFEATAELRSHADQKWIVPSQLKISCSRQDHLARFEFEVLDDETAQPVRPGTGGMGMRRLSLIKVGQYPSLTDFQLGELGDFEDGMSKAQRKEYVRAINTGAHGFAVAACVYFRRLFEGVLLEAREEYVKSNGLAGWPEFDRARTDERIKLLDGYLPAFMGEHPHLYSLLSLGVHELAEEQCADELPVLRQAIELIFGERLAARQAEKQRSAVSKLLAQRTSKHRG